MAPADPHAARSPSQARAPSSSQRSEWMTIASDARGKGDRKRAIDAYHEVLAHDADDPEVHGKLAQLLAESGDGDGAARHYQLGVDGWLQRGFADRAIALLKQAIALAPHDIGAVVRLADLHVTRDKRADAVKLLLEARARFVKKAELERARTLLWKALEIAPKHADATLDLARVLKRLGRRDVARSLLEELLGAVAGAGDRKRVRRALFHVAPSPASWWRWLRNAAPPPA